MNINESVSFSAQIMVKDSNNSDVQVMYLSASIDTANLGVSITANTTNKTLALSNTTVVKEQYKEFEAAVKNRAVELGYIIF